MEKEINISKIPKIELHCHVEGTITPEFVWKKAKKHNIKLPYKNLTELKMAYKIKDLNDFLAFHYQNISVLKDKQDFFDITWNYLQEAKKCNIIHIEMFVGPQMHIIRGVKLEDIIEGINQAFTKAQKELAITSRLIINFAKERPIVEAIKIFNQCKPFFKDKKIIGIGLDSFEIDGWEQKFKNLFKKAKKNGLYTTAHADEEKASKGIFNLVKIIETLPLNRIDYGLLEISKNPDLLSIIKNKNIHLTLSPWPVKVLNLWSNLETYPIKKLLTAKISFSINSDDPAYFKGNINKNYQVLQDSLNLSSVEWKQILINTIYACFINQKEKNELLKLINSSIQLQ